MPHSGGGGSRHSGSHSGRSHSSFHNSSGGSSSSGTANRVSKRPFAGAHRYAIYNRYSSLPVRYAYARTSEAFNAKKPTAVFFVFSVFLFLIGLALFFGALFSEYSFWNVKVNPEDGAKVEVVDEYNLFASKDEKQISIALQDFMDETGIAPTVEFIADSIWEEECDDLSTWAYNDYLRRFDDEKHVLIVYSIDDSKGIACADYGNFNWESMWGDKVDCIVFPSDENFLTYNLQNALIKADGDKTEICEGIANSFAALTNHITENSVRGKYQSSDVVFVIFVGYIALIMEYPFFNYCLIYYKYKRKQRDGEYAVLCPEDGTDTDALSKGVNINGSQQDRW